MAPHDAEPEQPLLDLARRHRRAVVGEQGPGQGSLHEGLAEAVDEDLGGLLQIPLQVTAQARVVIEEAEQDGRLPLARRRQHAALAVVEVGMPQRVAAGDLVAQHLAGFGGRLVLDLVPLPGTLADQAAIAHRPRQRRVGRHRAQPGILLHQRLQIVVAQLCRPRGMGPVLLAQRRDQPRRHGPLAADVGPRLAAQRLDRVLILCPRPVVPALDRGHREAHRALARRVFPVAFGEPLEFNSQLPRRWGRRQERSDDRKAQARPPVATVASVAAAHLGIPPWLLSGGMPCTTPYPGVTESLSAGGTGPSPSPQ